MHKKMKIHNSHNIHILVRSQSWNRDTWWNTQISQSIFKFICLCLWCTRDICKISFCKSHCCHGSSFGSVKTYSRNLHCILQEIRRLTHFCTQEFGIGGGELSLKESAREHALKRHCAHFPPSFFLSF
jgi:hypothetical protein